MTKCTFCGSDIEKGTSILYFRDNGKFLNFCSGKCEKNLLTLKRKPREQKWTEIHLAEKRSKK